MMLTIEERLEKAIDFIKSIDKLSLQTLTTRDIIDSAHVYCDECGDECTMDFTGLNSTYVEANAIDELKDKAWHLLADIAY